MADAKQPKLTHSFDLTVIGPPGFASEASPHSDLSVAHVYEGSLKSADGAIEIPLTAGSDWMRLHKDYADIDARVSCASLEGTETQLQCDVEYKGKIAFHGPMLQLWKGEKDSLDWCEGYYYTTPLLSSRCQELAWVNEAVFLGMGKIGVNEAGKVQVVYRIFKVG
ncbi:hypothetical protein ACJZ2D_001702 [Fusarium nematophilum]